MSGQVDLDALRALEAAATPGPWRSDVRDGERLVGIDGPNYAEVLLPGRVDCMAYCYGGSSRIEGDNLEADAAFIAAARNALVPLLDEIESLRARVAAVEALARDWQWYVPAAAFRAALEAKP